MQAYGLESLERCKCFEFKYQEASPLITKLILKPKSQMVILIIYLYFSVSFPGLKIIYIKTARGHRRRV